MIDNIRSFSYESSILNEKYNKYIHSSGLEIYVFKKKMSTAYALLGTKYGSIHNKFNLNGEIITVPVGIAHFLEHSFFLMRMEAILLRGFQFMVLMPMLILHSTELLTFLVAQMDLKNLLMS